MRPIRLTIAGLHSFREPQTIDFERVSDAGVFGIFGPTGSGKSTILDAMTLALFGAVGRAPNRTQGILNHAEQAVSVSYVFDIGKDDQRRRLVAERQYKPGRDSSLRQTVSRLYEKSSDGSNVVLADRAQEMNAAIRNILGLELEDFSRAVVLPQGKFAEFLHLDGARRREMLERLFSLEQFGQQLMSRLRERVNEIGMDVRVVNERLNEVADASEEALLEAKACLADATAEDENYREMLGAMEQQAERAKAIYETQRSWEAGQEALRIHLSKEDVVDSARERIRRHQEAEQLAPILDQASKARNRVGKIQEEGSALEKERTVVHQQLEEALSTYAEHREAFNAQEPKLSEQLWRLKEFVPVEQRHGARGVVIDRLRAERDGTKADLEQIERRVSREEQEIEALEKELVALRKRHLGVTPSSEERAQATLIHLCHTKWHEANHRVLQLKEDTRARRQEFDAVVATMKQLDSRKTLNENSFRECEEALTRLEQEAPSREEWDRLREGSRQAEELATRLEQLTAKCMSSEQSLVVRRGERVSCTAELDAAIAERSDVEGTLHRLNEELAQLRVDDVRTAAARLAEQLIPGEPCPVCGSMDHPIPAWSHAELGQHVTSEEPSDTGITDQLRQKEQEIDLVKQLYAQRIESENQTSAQRLQVEITLQHEEERHAELWTELCDVNDSFERLSGGTGRVRLDRDPVQSLNATMFWRAGEGARIWANQVTEQAKCYGQQMERWEQQREEWTRTRDQKREAAEQARTDLLRAMDRRASCELEWMNVSEAHEKSSGVEQKLRTELANHLSTFGAITFEAFQEQLVAREREAKKLGEETSSLEDLLAQRRKSLVEWHGRREEGRNALIKLETQIAAETNQWEVEQGQLKALLETGETILTCMARIETKLNELRTARDDCESLVQGLSAAARTLDDKYVEWTARRDEVYRDRDQRETEVWERLIKSPFTLEEEVDQARLGQEAASQLGERIQLYDQRTIYLKAQVEQLTTQLGENRINETEWRDIQTVWAETKESALAATRALIEAEKDVRTLSSRHERWRELSQRRKEIEAQAQVAGELRQLLRGDVFVEYLAQERLDYVARDASARLKSLTRGRYALEVDSQGGFLIRDDSNGGVTRGVATLSGGETFLTSLALALSLSTQIQLKGQPLELFFLDEGFGTLDPELLDIVMTSLEQLHMELMTIGVISHVPELRQRMPRRILVDPPSETGSGSRVRLEVQ